MSQSEISLEILNIQNSQPSPPQNTPLMNADDNQQGTSADGSEPPKKQRRCSDNQHAIMCVGVAIIWIVAVPIILLSMVVAYVVCGVVVNEGNSDQSAKNPNNNQFIKKAAKLQGTANKIVKVLRIIGSRVVILLLVWLIVNLSVPGLKNKFLYGSKLWKWSLLVAMLSCGYNVINLAARLLLCILASNKKFRSNMNAVYFAKGLRRSVNLIVLFGSILLTWIFYFRTSRGIKKTSDTNVVLHIGTWTFGALFVGSVLWLLKNILMLQWEADVVYKRFGKRILNAGFQFYFLCHICGWHLDIFQPRRIEQTKGYGNENQDKTEDQTSMAPSSDANTGLVANLKRTGSKVGEGKAAANAVDNERKSKAAANAMDNERKSKEREEDKKKAKDILIQRSKLYQHVTMYDIKEMTKYFVDLSKVLREDDGTSDDLPKFQEIIQCDNKDIKMKAPCNLDMDAANRLYSELLKEHRSEQISFENFQNWMVYLFNFELGMEDAKLLYSELLKEHGSEQMSLENFQKWMVKGHKNCLALGYTLLDAKGVVNVLNKVTTGLLITIVFVAWLLLTDIVSTKLLVVIASPFLAATFMFGDTCKNAFEGIIFSFVNHPFDVGDRCIIDGVELEVKRMSILATTFIPIETKEEVLYPNSALATKSIINLKWEPDPNDKVELTLECSWTKLMFDELQTKVNEFFQADKKFEKANTVIIKEIGDSIKMTIQYQNVMSIYEATHSQCLEMKRKQRSAFLLKITEFMEAIKKKQSAV